MEGNAPPDSLEGARRCGNLWTLISLAVLKTGVTVEAGRVPATCVLQRLSEAGISGSIEIGPGFRPYVPMVRSSPIEELGAFEPTSLILKDVDSFVSAPIEGARQHGRTQAFVVRQSLEIDNDNPFQSECRLITSCKNSIAK